MKIKTRQDYIESLRKLKLNLWMFGERVASPVDHPIIIPSMNAVSFTYELALDAQHEDLMTATSHLTGKKINRFTHIFQSTEDLVKKVRRQRLLGQKTACCFQRCVGMDAFNSVYSTSFEIDAKHGTNYHQNLKKFLIKLKHTELYQNFSPIDEPRKDSIPMPYLFTLLRSQVLNKAHMRRRNIHLP